ncbi:MAG: RIP metalloprotease RseP [Caldisericaceae bacterium]
MNIILTIIYGVVIIGVLALVHETGHFLAAKASGIPVEEFSIGFGPTVLQKKRGGTLYKVGLLPILGYVKIKGMEGDFDAPDGFFKKGLFQRFITLFMGPFMNFVAAVVIFAVVFSAFGNPLVPSTVISSVSSDSPAQTAGILPNDRITEINGNEISTWDDLTSIVHSSNGGTLSISLVRNGNVVTIAVQPKKDVSTGQWMIGVSPRGEKYNVFVSLWEAIKWTGKVLYQSFTLLPSLFTRKGLSSLTGPIGIVAMTGQAASYGFANLLWFAAFISIALGFTNLLPIPALDGSWIVLILWEAITRKPVPAEKQAAVQGAGFIFVLALMFLISINDIIKLFAK